MTVIPPEDHQGRCGGTGTQNAERLANGHNETVKVSLVISVVISGLTRSSVTSVVVQRQTGNAGATSVVMLGETENLGATSMVVLWQEQPLRSCW